MIKLGSLFDGSGGFPLAGTLHGIVPVWASEIEPYPMRVTALRFPNMKQLGDVTKINGAEIEPVNIISFGSPCQDLSVAGLQKGIHKGERSNLFFEAIRIIKEMRNATANVYPRFGVWENVPGAFSSNKGEDFRAVPVQKSDKPPRRYIVRRLTPLECCRLQGFPDWWEDGADGSDSARYKMWGNGIALPCAADVLGRIAEEMRKEAGT